MQTYKLLIYLAVWKRPEITEICFMGIKRLRKSGLFPIEAFAVISEESMIPLCQKYDVKYCMYKNEPLGEKLNYGLKEAMCLDWDYVICIGSDDLLYNEYLEEIGTYLGKRDFFGIDHFVFLNSEDGACRRFKTSTPYGMARAISRSAVEKVGNVWVDKKDRGMDNSSYTRMTKCGFMFQQIRTNYPLAIDIKSEENIWKFNYLAGKEYSFMDAVKNLSDDEIEALKSLAHADVEN